MFKISFTLAQYIRHLFTYTNQCAHDNVKKAVEAARGDWLYDDDLLNAIVDAIKSAEHASAQVMNLLSSMVEEK